MRAPFFEVGLFGDNAGLVFALVIGLAFGWFLEQGGMGSARKLAAQFYLTDFTVFKMMFSAIVTAMLGLYWLGRFGLIDLNLVYLPATYVLPQAVGGIVFGVGFVMGGLCPGTSCVAASTGRTDGLVVVVGMLFGVFGFALLYPMLEDFYGSTGMGSVTFASLLHVPYGVLVLLVVLVALAGFRLAEAIEARAG
ncbi:MAG TPA: YeeE/YedE thiosulfate transporter family protein [Gemmatimonadales bacterium]